MKNKLQNYFPIIRTRGEVLEELRENKELWKTFCGWKETCQQEYLDLCTGVKGIKLLYDCKRRGAEDRVSVPGREKCVLFGGSATETV